MNKDNSLMKSMEKQIKKQNKLLSLNSQALKLEQEEKNHLTEKSGNKGRRQNEKTIGYAVIKVFQWEKIREKSKNNITLDDAAKCIGMAKKTLDDYKNQIKKLSNRYNQYK